MADESIGLRLELDNEPQYVGGARRAAEATHQLDTSMQSVSRNSGRFGLAVNAMAQGLEDLQYGVGGAMNNLSQVAMLMGAGGLVIAGVTLTGIAVNQLVKHWGDLMELLGSTHIKTAAEEMKELAEATNRTGAQAERLRELKAEDKAEKREKRDTEAADDLGSSEAKKRGGEFTKLVSDALKPGQTSQDFIDAFVRKRIQEQTQRGFAPDAMGRELIREQMATKFGRAMSGNTDDAYFLELEARQDKTGNLKGFNEQIAAAKRKEALEDERKTRKMISHAEFESEQRLEQQRKDAIDEERRLRKMIAHGEFESEQRQEAQDTKALTRQGEMNEADLDMPGVKRAAAQADARRKERQYAKAMFDFQMTSAGRGGMGAMQRQMIRQQWESELAFNGQTGEAEIQRRRMLKELGLSDKGQTGMSIMQRQMAARFGQGPMPPAQQESYDKLVKASDTFESAVKKLADGDVRIVL